MKEEQREAWPPDPNAVAVCLFPLDVSPKTRERWHGTLDSGELARAAEFHFARDRERFMTVHGALRTLLGRILDRPPQGLQFETGPWGRPYLTGNPIRFSVSHSRSWALLAVGRQPRLGIDLEPVRDLNDLEGLARVAFSEPEHRALLALPPEHRPAAFFRVWTRKEAVAKALGEGLRAMKRFAVSVDTEPRLLTLEGEPQTDSQWRLEDLTEIPNHTACLAVEARDWHIVQVEVP